MRTLAKILLIPAGIAAIAMLFQSCTKQFPIEQSVLIDLTEDSFLVKPDAQQHKKLFTGGNELWSGFNFRISAITDVVYNPVHEASIPPACELTSNRYSRKKQLKSFYSQVDSAFKTVLDTPPGKTRSSIYFPMAMEVNRLFKSRAQRKILVAYTDLMEHTSMVSFYDKNILNLIKNDPDSVRRILETEALLPDLSGIAIYFVYQPRNAAESMVFLTVSEFYRNWLESMGAKVVIGANFLGQ